MKVKEFIVLSYKKMVEGMKNDSLGTKITWKEHGIYLQIFEELSHEKRKEGHTNGQKLQKDTSKKKNANPSLWQILDTLYSFFL